MPKKEKKKKESWRERQRKRQLKQQRAQEAYEIQREREAEKRPRKWPKGKMILGFCLIALMFTAYGTWQYFEGQKPPAIGGTTNNPPPTGSAPNFSLKVYAILMAVITSLLASNWFGTELLIERY